MHAWSRQPRISAMPETRGKFFLQSARKKEQAAAERKMASLARLFQGSGMTDDAQNAITESKYSRLPPWSLMVRFHNPSELWPPSELRVDDLDLLAVLDVVNCVLSMAREIYPPQWNPPI